MKKLIAVASLSCALSVLTFAAARAISDAAKSAFLFVGIACLILILLLVSLSFFFHAAATVTPA
jgi:hypothetical protein